MAMQMTRPLIEDARRINAARRKAQAMTDAAREHARLERGRSLQRIFEDFNPSTPSEWAALADWIVDADLLGGPLDG